MEQPSPPQAPVRIDIALLLDDAPNHLLEAEACIGEAQLLLSQALASWDLLFLEPALLVCLLHLRPETFDQAALVPLAQRAREHGLRVLKPALIGTADSQRLYAERLTRFGFRELDVRDPGAAFALLAEHLRSPRPNSKTVFPNELRFTVRFQNEAAFLAAYSTGPDDSPGTLRLTGQAVPSPGAGLALELEFDTGQGPFELIGRVLGPEHVSSAAADSSPGFSVALVVPPGRAAAFAALLTSIREQERSATLPFYNREPRPRIRLPVEYFAEDRQQVAFSGNLSLGGLFLECDSPSAIGTELPLHLYAVGRTHCVPLLGRVVHRLSKPRAAVVGRKAGAGIKFLEPRDVVASKLAEIIGSLDTPAVARAMVVDDDRFFRVLLTNLLSHEGFMVQEAGDGREAFGQLFENLLGLDLLLVDLNLPEGSGQEIIEMVRSVGGQAEVPVVVITGAALSAAEVNQIRQLGADAVLAKSLPADQLWQQIARVLKARYRQRQRRRDSPPAETP